MSNGTLTLRSLDIPSIHKFGIGFESVLDELMRMNAGQTTTNYPPYNIIKCSENDFNIELALAGFAEGEIDIKIENRVLTITGTKHMSFDTPIEYLHHGISNRNFVREFTLAEHVEVKDASNANGILTLHLERKLPKEMQPKSIAIKYNT
jgi:molecular chaperone IbpA